MSKFDSQKIITPIMKFVNMRGIIALKDGMLAILPLTVVGSLFLILGQLPFKGLNQAIANVFGPEWTEPFMQVYSGTFAIMGLISCFAIAYAYAKNSSVEPLPAGVLSLSSFFILMKSSYIPVKGEAIADAISKVWFGGQGIIGAIIIGLVVGAIYTWFIQHHIVIKMPEQVPQAIAKQFEAMIPAFVIFLLSMIVYLIAKVTTGGTFIEMIYDIIQVPLQGLTGSLYGAIGIAFFISFLFGFPIVMNPVMFLPFILVPVLAALIVYGAIAVGFMQPFSGVTLPWSTPAIISGFMVGGWQGALVQIVILAISTAVYFPFFKIQDNITYKNECEMERG